MALSQRLEIRQSQSLVMTPQLMQAIKLLQLSNLDLVAYVEGELERNPLLERESEGSSGAADNTEERREQVTAPSGEGDGQAGDYIDQSGGQLTPPSEFRPTDVSIETTALGFSTAYSVGDAARIGVGIEHPKYFDSFDKKVRGLDEVLECHRVAGEDSYLLKVRTRNTRTLDRLLVQVLRTTLGMPLYGCQPPTGYKTTADAWINTGALLARMNFGLQLASNGQPRAMLGMATRLPIGM